MTPFPRLSEQRKGYGGGGQRERVREPDQLLRVSDSNVL
eukprot:gene44828-37860_t